MKKSFVRGAIVLGIASIICKLFGAIFRIPLTFLINADGMGLYQLVYPIFALCLVASSGGIPTSMSKIISKERTKRNNKNILIIFKMSIKIMLILSVFFSILIALLSPIISNVQGNNNLFVCYLILSPAIVFGALVACLRGYFQGFEEMRFSALSQVLEQFFKLIFGMFFAFIFQKFGVFYSVFGVFLGINISELISLTYLFLCYKKRKIYVDFSKNVDEEITKKEAFRLIFKEALPITLTSIVVPLTGVIDSLIIIKLLQNSGFDFTLSSSLYGLDSGVVASLINLPSVVAISLSTSLMPSISASFALKNTKDINFKIKFAIKIVWYFTLFCALCYFIFSKQICYFLYGKMNSETFNQLNTVSLMLKFSSFSIIYIAINQLLITLLQAANESYYCFFAMCFSVVIKIVLTIVLVLNKNLNIYGLVVGDVLCYATALLLNLLKARKVVEISYGVKEFFLVPLLSLFNVAIVLFAVKFFTKNLLSRPLILLTLGVCFVIYLFSIFVFKGFNKKEINFNKIMKKFTKKR